jgi:hypothetical protein
VDKSTSNSSLGIADHVEKLWFSIRGWCQKL